MAVVDSECFKSRKIQIMIILLRENILAKLGFKACRKPGTTKSIKFRQNAEQERKHEIKYITKARNLCWAKNFRSKK